MECRHNLSPLPYFVFICSCKLYNRCNSVSQRGLRSQMNKLKPFRFPSLISFVFAFLRTCEKIRINFFAFDITIMSPESIKKHF